MNMRSFFILLLCGGFLFTSCDDDEDTQPEQSPKSDTLSVYQQISGYGNLATLEAALERTGLESTLNDPDASYTVFAPTDAAFTNLLETLGVNGLEGLEAALGGEAALRNVLLYHVFGQEIAKGDVNTGFATTLASRLDTSNAPIDGQRLDAYLVGGEAVTINGAQVVQADLASTNGVVHVIDQALTPLSVLEIATFLQEGSALVDAVGDADSAVAATLAGEGPVTLFAPTDTAFGAVDDVLQGLSMDQLSTVLTYHVVPGSIRSDQVPADTVATAAGQNLVFTVNGGTIAISDADTSDGGSDATVVAPFDVQGANGVVHSIDGVLIPQL